MQDRDWYFIPTSRVHEVFGKLERWSIIDLYRTAHVLPSVAENVLANLRPHAVARVVGETPVNRWGASYPIYEFLDEEKKSEAYHRRLHSHCYTSGISEAAFVDDFCERPFGFIIPNLTSALNPPFNSHAAMQFEVEHLGRSREQYERTVQRGMYEDSEKAAQVFGWYKTMHAVLLDLWALEIELAKSKEVKLPDEFAVQLSQAAGGLMLAGQHHVACVKEALDRWYKSPLVSPRIAYAVLDAE